MVKLKFEKPYDAICAYPKINGIFHESSAKQLEQLFSGNIIDGFCKSDKNPSPGSLKIADELFKSLKYGDVSIL